MSLSPLFLFPVCRLCWNTSATYARPTLVTGPDHGARDTGRILDHLEIHQSISTVLLLGCGQQDDGCRQQYRGGDSQHATPDLAPPPVASSSGAPARTGRGAGPRGTVARAAPAAALDRAAGHVDGSSTGRARLRASRGHAVDGS